MSQINEQDPRTIELKWPECPFLESRCLLDELGQALGPENMEALMTFILVVQPGSRLSLQRNQNEITSQLTGPVLRGSSDQVALSDFQDLLPKLTQSK